LLNTKSLVNVESLLGLTLKLLTKIVDMLIQVVIDTALDILPRLSSGLLHTEVELGYAEVLDRCGSIRPGVPGSDRVSRTSPVVEDKEPIHRALVVVVVSPDRGLTTERTRLDLYVHSRLNVEVVVVVGHSQIRRAGRTGGIICVLREGLEIPASCAYEWSAWMITCQFASSEDAP